MPKESPLSLAIPSNVAIGSAIVGRFRQKERRREGGLRPPSPVREESPFRPEAFVPSAGAFQAPVIGRRNHGASPAVHAHRGCQGIGMPVVMSFGPRIAPTRILTAKHARSDIMRYRPEMRRRKRPVVAGPTPQQRQIP